MTYVQEYDEKIQEQRDWNKWLQLGSLQNFVA